MKDTEDDEVKVQHPETVGSSAQDLHGVEENGEESNDVTHTQPSEQKEKRKKGIPKFDLS